MKHFFSAISLVCLSITGIAQKANKKLAKEIVNNKDFALVVQKGKGILKKGFNAGDRYGKVWATENK